jgi:acyl carrier protein
MQVQASNSPADSISNPALPTEIQTKVNNLFVKGFEIPAEKITPTASLYDDLGLDSLDAVDMLVHLEEAFHIKVDGERLMDVRTIQNVYDLVKEVALQSNVTAH